MGKYYSFFYEYYQINPNILKKLKKVERFFMSLIKIPESYLNCRNLEARNCLNACKQGYYINKQNKKIQISELITNCLINTRSFPPKFQYEKPILETRESGIIEIRNESTLKGTYRMSIEEKKSNICALNFANAFNPGGGFLGSARAQEETLCRSSALYYSLIQQMNFYQYHQKKKIANTASNYIIFSPDCPTWKTDNYVLLDKPYLTSYITCAAVHNCGKQKRAEIKQIHDGRIRAIIDCAISNGVKNIVLGAFGCGAFSNNPDDMAQSFKQYLVDEEMRFYFESISFSIIGFTKTNIDAFSRAFNLPIV